MCSLSLIHSCPWQRVTMYVMLFNLAINMYIMTAHKYHEMPKDHKTYVSLSRV